MWPADLNVSSMLTVLQLSSVAIFIVLIPAQVSVAPMPTAKLPIISLFVSVTRDTSETHSCLVEDHHLLQNQLWLRIPVIPIPVDLTVNLQELSATDANVTVFQRCLALLPTAGQNVRSMLTAQLTKPASTGSVKILALASVESMLTAESEIIFLFVSVTKVILVIPSQAVTSNQVRDQVF
jgi:hypothetical protein